MKNIALHRPTVLQLDADGTDGALDAAADRDVLRDDAALDLGAVADEKIGGAQLAFDAAVDLRRTATFDVAHDRHSGADARAWPRIRRRLPSRVRARADAEPFTPRREDPQVRTPCENRTAQSRMPPRWSLRLRAIPP